MDQEEKFCVFIAIKQGNKKERRTEEGADMLVLLASKEIPVSIIAKLQCEYGGRLEVVNGSDCALVGYRSNSPSYQAKKMQKVLKALGVDVLITSMPKNLAGLESLRF